MTTLDNKKLKAEAKLRLEPMMGQARKLTLIYLGAVALLTLLGEAVSLMLQYWINGTGGLEGLGLRSVLQTAQSVLPYVTAILSPIWTAGYLRATLCWAEGQQAAGRTLLSGFPRTGAVMAYELLWGLLVFGLFLFATNAASAVYMLMPQAEELVKLMAQVSAGEVSDLSALSMEEYLRASLPMMVITLVIGGAMVVYMSYNLRLSRFLIVDGAGMGGFAAMRNSLRLMRGHKLAFFKLELSFWWFYALMIGAVAACGGGMYFLLLALKVDATVAYFLIYAVCLLAAGLFSLWKMPHIDTTMALAYRQITTPENE